MTANKVLITSSSNQATLAEQYLINKLDKIYGKSKCFNDYNIDSTIAQRGGAGKDSNGPYNIYVMYK